MSTAVLKIHRTKNSCIYDVQKPEITAPPKPVGPGGEPVLTPIPQAVPAWKILTVSEQFYRAQLPFTYHTQEKEGDVLREWDIFVDGNIENGECVSKIIADSTRGTGGGGAVITSRLAENIINNSNALVPGGMVSISMTPAGLQTVYSESDRPEVAVYGVSAVHPQAVAPQMIEPNIEPQPVLIVVGADPDVEKTRALQRRRQMILIMILVGFSIILVGLLYLALA